MEFFERAHGVKNTSSKNKKINESKKMQLKQMLFGYKANDNKIIEKSAELQNDYEDSISVSGYSDLNITNSSYENESDTPILKEEYTYFDKKKADDDKVSKSSYSECSDDYQTNELKSVSDSKNIQSIVISDNESNDKFSEELSDDDIVNSNDNQDEHDKSSSESDVIIDSLERNEIVSNDSIDIEQEDCSNFGSELSNDYDYDEFVTNSDLNSGADSDMSTIISGLNLSESDDSEFDADRQLARRIKEKLQQQVKDNTGLEQNDNPKGPITKERCLNLQTQELCTVSDKHSSKKSKNKKRKHKDTITVKGNDVAKTPKIKETCIKIKEDEVLKVSSKELKERRKNKQKHRDKYTIELDENQRHIQNYNIGLEDLNTAGPVNVERFSEDDDTQLSMSKNDLSICNRELSSDELDKQSDNIESAMSPPFISITASDMPTERLDDIIGEYKHSTIKILPSENSNVVFTNQSGLFIEEHISSDEEMFDDHSSLVPEVDDIPKLEEIDDEPNKSTNKIWDTSIATESEISDQEESINYLNVPNTFKIYYGTNCCIITLRHPSQLYIQGKVKVTCIAGSVEMFGYKMAKECYEIYAPYYNFAQCIKTIENDNNYFGLFGKLTALGLTVSEAEDITTSVGEYNGVLVLQKLRSKVIDFVAKNFQITTMFKSNKPVEPYFSKVCNLLDCSLFSMRPFKCFEEHPSWSEANELAMNKYSRGLVCGGKGAGKSTYVRYQVNKLLAHGPVLVVDLDPGQSLFTVAGSVSATVVTSPLFGPTFTHLKKPELMLNIGMINTMDNSKLYASAVQSLITFCHNNKSFTQMPWVVNTMGMTNSLGLKFITLIITLVKPTYLLQYESEAMNLRFETLLTPTNVKELYEDYKNDRLFSNLMYPEELDYSFVIALDSDSRPQIVRFRKTFSLRAKDERYLNFLAYFSQLLMTVRGESLLSITPYVVSLRDLCIATNVVVRKEHIIQVLNGKLVALCQQARDSVALFTLTDKPLRCVGHGLIRGIDWEKEQLYVTTPVPSNELGDVDTVLYADWMPDLMWHESQLPLGVTLPYRTITEDKQLMSTPRRRFNNPLQVLKMAGVPN